MILGYGIATMVVGVIGALLCLGEALRKRGPNDFTMGATLVIALMLLVQIIISIAAPFSGNPAMGDPLEFWMYLIVAFALPVGAGFWALIDRTKWANLVLAVIHVSVAVMTYRMLVIWG
ncbi:hypothetical protein [Leucobacter luti]|uniref:Uncharacterized protein n=1 Tax=Leucobacter luti TaxID=340320 RepID=A0A4R6S9Q4_9MICO|nr:hypothetical protein [Leucobacter luti]MCW2288809.1 hypothetical protein [Leucobacter luti]QYM75288.1 hypothetical protein K1X41_11615 [Leucobacter luti]TCK45039.1 hypothetical protein EDF60_0258 [Leucobacter luti]TDP95565.1 hypothetical protein EDF62_0254 [Leucobacter luti]